jgi:hypothetical protein
VSTFGMTASTFTMISSVFEVGSRVPRDDRVGFARHFSSARLFHELPGISLGCPTIRSESGFPATSDLAPRRTQIAGNGRRRTFSVTLRASVVRINLRAFAG